MIQVPVYPPPLEKISSSTHFKTVSPNQSSPQWILPGPPDPLCDDGGGITKNKDIGQNTSQPKINAVSLPSSHVIFPSEVLPIPLPLQGRSNSHISITPSFPGVYENASWSPQVCDVINGQAMYRNNSNFPLVVPKFAHFKPHPVLFMSLTDVTPDS